MKHISTLLVIVTMTCSLIAQIPQKISYQCIVRSAGGALVTNQSIGVKISILQDSPTGTLVYQEIFNPNPQTNSNGLLTMEIGTGIPIAGPFTNINWSSGTYFLKTEIDPVGTTNYTIVSTSQLISVPYAFHSQTAAEVADNSVTSSNIVDGSIATADLADGSVTSAKIADGSVNSAKIADGNVFTADLANNSVTTEKIADGSVNSAKISDGSIATADLANNSVTSAKIADGTITTADLADGSITSAKISDGTVSNVDLANNSVTSAKIVDGTIITADLANSSVTAAKISNSGAGTNHVLQYNGTTVDWDYAPGSLIKYSFLNANCPGGATHNFTNTFSKISNIGTISKADATSKLEVTYYGRIFVATFNESTGAYFELRVNDNPTTNGRANVNLRASEAGGYGIPASFTGVFTGLSAGIHTISMWVRAVGSTGTGTLASYNPGCWQGDYVIVREIK